MWRMMPTPDGIAQLWNFSVFGSKRTSASGRCHDSLYQMTSSITSMAYGCDCGPLGDGHSLTSPVWGFRCPSRPSDELTNHTVSSLVIASRRDRVPGSGSTNSRTSMVCGFMLTSLFEPLEATQIVPFESCLMP